ncbi:MAG: ATP-binding protein [Syntrophobacterales bacterium]|jgi:PAS domain S-box-containing protein
MKGEDRKKEQLEGKSVELVQHPVKSEHPKSGSMQANEPIASAKDEWERTFNIIPDPIAIIDRDYRITWVNRAMAERLGIVPHEAVGMTCYQNIHGMEKPPSFCPHTKLLADGKEHTAEIHETRLGGDFRVSVSPLRTPDGSIIGSIHLARDITESKLVEEELRRRSHDLGERLKELHCLFDVSRLIERQEIARSEIFQGIVNLIPPAWQYPEITCARVILGEQEFRTANFRETNWKQVRDITVHGEVQGSLEVCYLDEKPECEEGPFMKEERSLLNAIAERFGRLIEREEAEEALQEAYDHLEMQVERRTAELAKANEELQVEINERKRVEEALRKSSEKLESFAYSVMHDLKSPSVGIYGLTELLNKHYKDVLDERGRNYCEQILKSAVHLAALIEKINVYITTKEAPLNLVKNNVKEILEIVRDEFSPRLAVRQIEWHEPEIVPEVKVDKLSMIRVFRNFVDNALKYGGEDLSEIRIGHQEFEDFHVFSVSDNGAGLKGTDYERLFAPFRRDDASKVIDGAGLGLAIVSEIAERHRGSVWAEPGEVKGTTFHISVSKDL